MSKDEDDYARVNDTAKQQMAETLREMMDPLITPLLTKAAEVLVSKGGERALNSLQAAKKVVVQVLDSDFKDGYHSVDFKVWNSSMHGVYLESVELVAPK